MARRKKYDLHSFLVDGDEPALVMTLRNSEPSVKIETWFELATGRWSVKVQDSEGTHQLVASLAVSTKI